MPQYYKITITLSVILLLLGVFSAETIVMSDNYQISIEEKDQLVQVLRTRYPYATDYQLYISGRTLKIPMSQVPYLVGKDPSNVCVLAYVDRVWKQLPFTFSEGEEIIKEKDNRVIVLRQVPDKLTGDTVLLVQMPANEPTFTDLSSNFPPQAIGAREWYWINVRTVETPESYPILIVIDSPQIKETCGSTAKLYAESYGIAGELKGDGVPWILNTAIREDDLSLSFKALKEIMEPKDAMASVNASTSYDFTDDIFPSGERDVQDSRYITMITTPKKVIVSNGYTMTRDVSFNLSDGEEAYFTIRLNSPTYTKIIDKDLSVTKIIVSVYGITSNPSEYELATVSITLFPGTQYQQTKSNLLLSTDSTGDYRILEFTPPPMSPQEFPLNPPGEIPLKIKLSSNGGNEWILSLKFDVKVVLENFDNYISQDIIGVFKYQFIDCAQEPCSNLNNQYPIKLVLPAESTRSNTILYIGTPEDIAIVENTSSYYDNITLQVLYKVKIPPGYPGGYFHSTISGLGNCTNSLPANPGPDYMIADIDCNYSIGKDEILDFFVKPFGLIALEITSSSSNPSTLTFEIYASSNILELKNLPYIKLPYSTTEYYVTPIAGFKIMNKNYLAKPILREIHEINKHGVINDLNKWLNIRWKLSSHTYMIINTDIGSNEMINRIEKHSEDDLESFTIYISWKGKGSCVDPIIDVNAMAETSDSFAGENKDTWLSKVSSWFNEINNELLTIISNSLSAVNLVLEYKDLTTVSVEKGCTSSSIPGGEAYAYVRVTGDEAGWDPVGFNNNIGVYIYNYIFDESLCVNVDTFSLKITTEEGYISYDKDSLNIEFCPIGSLYGG